MPFRPSGPQSLQANRIMLLALGAVLLIVAILRLSLLPIPLERDEGEYAYIARLILGGLPPYVHAYTMKLPGTHLIYAAILSGFGRSVVAIHFGLFLASAVATSLIWLLALELFDSVSAAIGATAAFAVLALSPSSLGFAAHATQFVVVFTTLAAVLVLRAARSGRSSDVFACGLSLGCALLVKQHAIIIAAFMGIWLASTIQVRRRRAVGLLILGVILPYLLTCIWIWRVGGFGQFWRWTVEYAGAYLNEAPWGAVVPRFIARFTEVAAPNVAFWLLAATGFVFEVRALLRKAKDRNTIFVLGFAAASFAAVVPGFTFRPHYFVIFFPAAALLVGVTFAKLPQSRVPLVFMLTTFSALAAQWLMFFHLDPTALSRKIYVAEPFAESAELARYLSENSAPDARIAVLGSEPQLYFLADRNAVTNHLYAYPLVEHQPYAKAMQEEIIRDVEDGRPQLVVVVNVPSSWATRPDAEDKIFKWMDPYLTAHYNLEGIVAIHPRAPADFLWNEQARKYAMGTRSPFEILIFKAKTDGNHK